MQLIKLMLLFTIAVGGSAVSVAQTGKKFKLSASINGLNNVRVFLVKNAGSQGTDTICQDVAKQGKFKFKGVVENEGEGYFIKIENLDSIRRDKKSTARYITLVMQNRTFKINGSIDDLSVDGIAVTGLPLHEEYIVFRERLHNAQKHANEQAKLLNDAWKRKDSTVFRSEEEYFLKLRSINIYIDTMYFNWASEHLGSLLTPKLILSGITDEAKMEFLYSKLTTSVQISKFGRDLKQEFELQKRVKIGAVAPDFTFKTIANESVSLLEFASTNKITLLDFWSSWCKPCRGAFPEIKQLYAKYKSKGFNVIGLSIDKNETLWRNALKIDELPWINVIETDDFARKTYGVEMIPMTYILDNNGKIIAKDLSPQALEKKLAELLGSPGGK